MGKFKVLVACTVAGTDRTPGDIVELTPEEAAPLLENETVVSVEPSPSGAVSSVKEKPMAETKPYKVLGEVDLDIHGAPVAPGVVVELTDEEAGTLVAEGKVEAVPAGDNGGSI